MTDRWLLISGVCILCLSACAAPGLVEREAQREAALVRYHNCIARHADNPDTQAQHACSGHRRDVLVTYPPHLERQLDATLKRHALRHETQQTAAHSAATLVVPSIRRSGP